jgi:hypothetical protein
MITSLLLFRMCIFMLLNVHSSRAFVNVLTMVFLTRTSSTFLLLLLWLRAPTHRSGKLAFDEKPDIDIRDLLDDEFRDCLEEVPLNEDDFAPELGATDEDSESSERRGYLGAGLIFGATAVGVAGILGRAWEDDDDDLGVVVSEVVDVDDINTSLDLPRKRRLQGVDGVHWVN